MQTRQGIGMPFREKTAWLTLTTMIAAYALYFYLIGDPAHHGRPPLLDIILIFGAIAVGQALVVIVGSILLAVSSLGDARAPADERDRAIARRGASTGYYVLLIAVTLTGVVLPFSQAPWKVVNATLAAIVVAEVTRNAVVLLSYRRGWHG